MSKSFIILFLFLAFLAVIGESVYLYQLNLSLSELNQEIEDNRTACTMEAKLCPDGSYVGKTGPNCEFSQCPAEGKSGIKGIVLLGPICPVLMDPPDPKCADKSFSTKLVLTSQDQSRELLQFSSDKNGMFSIDIQPGEYSIRSESAGNIFPRCSSSGIIKVIAGKYEDIIINCDTGIR